jgi:hypothetical protein
MDHRQILIFKSYTAEIFVEELHISMNHLQCYQFVIRMLQKWKILEREQLNSL